jgi:LysM repeat protein
MLLGLCSLPAPTLQAAGACGNYYVVRSGDTLSRIATRCGVGTSTLARVNGLTLYSIIYPGQRLMMPSGYTAPRAPVPAPVPPAANGGTWQGNCPARYIVRSGDTLNRIAVRCGISVAALQRLNGLRSSLIWIGQVLLTRGVVVSPPAAPQAVYSPLESDPPPTPLFPDDLPPPTPAIESTVSFW